MGGYCLSVAQIVVYGRAGVIEARVQALSDAIHGAAVEALQLPETKRFHRFIPLAAGMLITPEDRSRDYTIIEVSMFEGRSTEAKKAFIRRIYDRLGALGIRGHDLEITITETPRENWGIRGVPADELELDYPVSV